MTRAELQKGLIFAFTMGLIGASLSVGVQVFNLGLWGYMLVSVIAFPLVGVSFVIHAPVAVIFGYILGNEGSVLVSAAVLFAFFMAVAFGQACVWFEVRRKRATSKKSAAG